MLRPHILTLLTLCAVAAQAPLSMPSWMIAYPGASPAKRASGAIVESTYIVNAQPAQVLEHYRKLFEAAGVPFQPNADGIGMAVRGSAAECDLLLLIRKSKAGTSVEVSCAPKSQPSSSTPADPVIARDDLKARHAELVAKLGIHPVYKDAPAPPLVWPAWLVHIKGAKIPIREGVDDSKKKYLEAQYTSNLPMTELYSFYEALLNSHEYRVHTSHLSTGQTISGIVQNAWGDVEGTNHPDGSPGPRTVIRVKFSRSVLNGPITVWMRITAYEYLSPKSRLSFPPQ